MVIPLNDTKEFTDNTCSITEEEKIYKNTTTVNKELYDWSEYTQVTTITIN